MFGEKNYGAGGLGELLDPSGHVDGVTDEGELQLPAAADGASDHHTGVDPDTDPKLCTEPLRNKAVNYHCSSQSRVGMVH